jgi:ketosteroid isomerase-like protein
MSLNARTELVLPPPITTYFAADRVDADTVVRCFHEDAVVVDEHRAHHGRAGIARWKAAASQYHYTSEPISPETSGGDTVVTASVTGAFPGSPAILRYRFTFENDAIVRLEIEA